MPSPWVTRAQANQLPPKSYDEYAQVTKGTATMFDYDEDDMAFDAAMSRADALMWNAEQAELDRWLDDLSRTSLDDEYEAALQELADVNASDVPEFDLGGEG